MTLQNLFNQLCKLVVVQWDGTLLVLSLRLGPQLVFAPSARPELCNRVHQILDAFIVPLIPTVCGLPGPISLIPLWCCQSHNL